MAKKTHRSSKTGRRVTKKFADANPDTTEAEAIRKPSVSLVDATNWARILLAQAAVRQIQPDGKRVTRAEHDRVMLALLGWQGRLEPIIAKAGR